MRRDRDGELIDDDEPATPAHLRESALLDSLRPAPTAQRERRLDQLPAELRADLEQRARDELLTAGYGIGDRVPRALVVRRAVELLEELRTVTP